MYKQLIDPEQLKVWRLHACRYGAPGGGKGTAFRGTNGGPKGRGPTIGQHKGSNV